MFILTAYLVRSSADSAEERAFQINSSFDANKNQSCQMAVFTARFGRFGRKLTRLAVAEKIWPCGRIWKIWLKVAVYSNFWPNLAVFDNLPEFPKISPNILKIFSSLDNFSRKF